MKTNKLIYAVAVICTFFLYKSTFAQWSTNPAVNNAICTATNNQSNTSIVSDGSGGAIITWVDERIGVGDTEIYAQRINSVGIVQWTADGIEICDGSSVPNNPALVSDGFGGAIITWEDYRYGSGLPAIFGQRINSAGVVQWIADGVEIGEGIWGQYFAQIVSDGAGGAIITWEDELIFGSPDIYAQRVNASGVIQWPTYGIAICSAANNQKSPKILSDGSGGAIITWTDFRSGASPDIYAQRVNSTGATQWLADGVAISTAANIQNLPAIISDELGGAIITWQDNRSGSTYDIYAQHINSTGIAQWTANGLSICTAANNQNSPTLVYDGSGGAIITWQDNRNGIYNDIYSQRVNAAGTVQWTADGVVLSTAAENQSYPAIVSDGSGGALITWQDNRSGLSYDIYVQHINATGTVQWTADGVSVSTAFANQTSPTIVSDGAGGAIITWKDNRNGSFDIYVQNVCASPPPATPSTISGATDVCPGTSNTYSVTPVSGATSYTWTLPIGWIGTSTTNSITVTSYSTSGFISVTANNGCGISGASSLGISLNILPTVTANATATTICNGTSVTLTGGGTTSYSWTGGVTDGTAFTPSLTTTYTVTGTNGAGCTNTDTITITVNALPTVTTNASSTTVCNGTAVTLTGGGATSYSWTGGVTDGISFTPSATTTYTVTGTSVGCTNTATVNVTVNSLPTVTANSSATTVCNGTAVTLTGGGTTSYSWTGGVTDGTAFTPSSTATYTVTGTDANGCINTSTVTIIVNPLPTVTANASSTTICIGTAITLTGGGATSYSWSAGVTDGSLFTPSSTVTYTVTGTDLAGCINTEIITITVNALPAVTANSSAATVCNGAAVTLTGSGAVSYSWSGGVTDGSSFTPASTSTYTVTGTDVNGCTETSTTSVNVNPIITSGITSTNASDCVACDGTATTSPIGGTPPYIYLWNDPGLQTTSTALFLCSGTYSVTIEDMAGCTITDSTTIFVSTDLIANFTMVPDSTNGYNLFAFNTSTGIGNSYSWDFGDGTTSTLSSPMHDYAAVGTYNVCLIASNSSCGADTLCKSITITGILNTCNSLFNIADDTINPDPNAHYVYNLSYGSINTYLWDFGDGTTSTSATPTHVYSGTGPYLLCLSIDDGVGCTDMFCDSLISADSLNRSSGVIQLTVYDVPTFYSIITDIENTLEAQNVTIAPNPFNETTIFTVNLNEPYCFELIDILGKKVKSKTEISAKQFEISREGLENGIYFYKIYTTKNLVNVGRVVIH